MNTITNIDEEIIVNYLKSWAPELREERALCQGDGVELSRWPWTAGPRAAEGAGARELRLKCAPGWVGRCMIAGRCVGVCMERHGQRMRSGCYLGLAARPFYTPACASEVRFAPPAPTQHTLGLQNTKIHMKRCGL